MRLRVVAGPEVGDEDLVQDPRHDVGAVAEARRVFAHGELDGLAAVPADDVIQGLVEGRDELFHQLGLVLQ